MSCVLTLRLDEISQAFFEKMRQVHFAPERNQIPAHLTLFHQLPETRDVLASLEAAADAQPAFSADVTGLRSIGRGVAYTLASPVLLEVHRRLTSSLDQYLIPQDRQRFSPHVVIQNKVTGDQARALLQTLQPKFRRWTVLAVGLDVWQYLGGPWQHAEFLGFKNDPGSNQGAHVPDYQPREK